MIPTISTQHRLSQNSIAWQSHVFVSHWQLCYWITWHFLLPLTHWNILWLLQACDSML
jgi:hypothetical protein